jgi:hypothetical protein
LAKFGEEEIATQLQSYSAEHDDSGIRINWMLSSADQNMKLSVLRRKAGIADYEVLDGSGLERENMSYSYVDDTAEPGATYYYRVVVEDEAGIRVLFETDAVSVPVLPLALHQNAPNPFNPATVISFTLPSAADVTLAVFDIAGRHIRTLVDGPVQGGLTKVAWDGLDAKGNQVGSGVYFYRLSTGKRTISRKMVLLR